MSKTKSKFIEYDATHEVCPVPLVNMRLMLKTLESENTLILTLLDSGSKKDIPKYLDKHQYIYVTKKIDLNVIEITIHPH